VQIAIQAEKLSADICTIRKTDTKPELVVRSLTHSLRGAVMADTLGEAW
jgi:hypothetical protein